MTLHEVLSDINFMLLNKSFSLGLFGWPKKSSGKIFFVAKLYYINIYERLLYYIKLD